jgi:tripartite-type tricarboxylate transporter receptor subunit TctC
MIGVRHLICGIQASIAYTPSRRTKHFTDGRRDIMRSLIWAVLLFGLGAIVPASVSAQEREWPSRPVTIVNLFGAGGNADVASRAVAQALSDKFGQSFVVENRPGGGGVVGSAYVAKAQPDGYTLITTSIGPAALNQLLFKSVPYDTDRDFTPIVMLGEVPNVIVSSPQLGFKTLSDLAAYGKSHPGGLNIGHAGTGSIGHLAATLFAAKAGVKATYIAYRSPGAVVTDVLSGQIQAGTPSFIPAVQSVTALAVTGDHRLEFQPNIPTARESGFDLAAITWFAILAPAGLPDKIRDQLNAAINDYLKSEDGRQTFAKMNVRAIGGTPEQLAQTIKKDRELWAPIIAKENIQLEAN